LKVERKTMHEHAHGHDAAADEAEHHDHGHGGLGKYIAVFIALCILTAISFGTAHFMMGPHASGPTLLVGRVVMIAVSCCKALLVMLFFMHLIWEANWKYVLTIPASIMSIFLLLMLFPDVLDRTRNYAEERWQYAATPVPAAESAEHNSGPAAESAAATPGH
jgi:cytochrome c oxidase subunit 4